MSNTELELLPPWHEADDESLDDWIYESRCKVCRLNPSLPGYGEFRKTLRTMFITSSTRRTYRELQRFLVRWPEDVRFSVDSLQTHLAKHMTPRLVAWREIRVQEARRDAVELTDELLENHFNPIANLKLIAAMGMEQLAAGSIQMKARDVERVNALISQLEPDNDVKAELIRVQQEQRIVTECVLRFLTNEQRQQLAEMLKTHLDPDRTLSQRALRSSASSYRPLSAARTVQPHPERDDGDDE